MTWAKRDTFVERNSDWMGYAISSRLVSARQLSIDALFLDIPELSVCVDEDGNDRVSVQRRIESAVLGPPICIDPFTAP